MRGNSLRRLHNVDFGECLSEVDILEISRQQRVDASASGNIPLSYQRFLINNREFLLMTIDYRRSIGELEESVGLPAGRGGVFFQDNVTGEYLRTGSGTGISEDQASLLKMVVGRSPKVSLFLETVNKSNIRVWDAHLGLYPLQYALHLSFIDRGGRNGQNIYSNNGRRLARFLVEMGASEVQIDGDLEQELYGDLIGVDKENIRPLGNVIMPR